MEWVETTGRTVDEATAAALDRLGVEAHDAEIQIVEEPRPGLFGRLRGEARVRARVRPTQARPKVERRDRKRRSRADETGATDEALAEPAAKAPLPDDDRPTPSVPRPSAAAASRDHTEAPAATNHQEQTMDNEVETEGGAAAEGLERAVEFVVGLVKAFGLDAEVTTVPVANGDVEIRVEGADVGLLIGPRGQTIASIQELARIVALHHGEGHAARIRVDVSGYRERRRQALSAFAERVAAEVVASGTARALEPMTSADRKVVHDAVATIPGVRTVSEGEDAARRVVILPAADD